MTAKANNAQYHREKENKKKSTHPKSNIIIIVVNEYCVMLCFLRTKATTFFFSEIFTHTDLLFSLFKTNTSRTNERKIRVFFLFRCRQLKNVYWSCKLMKSLDKCVPHNPNGIIFIHVEIAANMHKFSEQNRTSELWMARANQIMCAAVKRKKTR